MRLQLCGTANRVVQATSRSMKKFDKHGHFNAEGKHPVKAAANQLVQTAHLLSAGMSCCQAGTR
jgi:hypothetical protein